MIRLENVRKAYNDNVVINNFNYLFDDSGLYLIVGKSGIGKSTLLNIISFRDKDYLGSVICNRDIFYLKTEDLIECFSVKENIELIQESVKDFSLKEDLYGIKDIVDKKVNKLSGGEKQRLIFYISICTNKSVILLDEPTSNLDYKNKRIIADIIKKESKNRLFIVASHERNLFDEYNLIDLTNKFDEIKECNYINNKIFPTSKIKTTRWGTLLIFKNIVSLFLFFVSIFSLANFFSSFNNELDGIYTSFITTHSRGKLYYKENKNTLNDYYFYKEVILPLANEVVYYGTSVYSKDMYNHQVYLDNYYYSNGFMFSNLYVGENLKDNEVIVSVNLDKLGGYNYNKDFIKESLIGKYLKYKGKNIYKYKIKDVIDGEDMLYFSDPQLVREELSKEFEDYENRYYLAIDNKDKEDFYYNLNHVNELLKYDFINYFSDEHNIYYLVTLSDNEYFNYNELDSNDLIACSDSGISCNAFSFANFNSLYYIDEIVVKNKIKFEKRKNIGDNEIVVSSSLLNLINKTIGDEINLKFYIDDKVFAEKLKIIDVIESEEIKIYKDSSYSYRFMNNLNGESMRVAFSYGDCNSYPSRSLINEEIISESEELIFSFINIGKCVCYIICLLTLISLFFIEYKRNIKYKKIFSFLKMLRVANRTSVFYVFFSIYYLGFVYLFFINIEFSVIYLVLSLIFVYLSKIKIQVSLD